MCHGGVFERAVVPECPHTHTCAALGLCALAPPESAPSNRHDANIYHLPFVGCNKLYSCSQTKECITKDLDHIPHSVHFKFKLGASMRVLEHYSEQFKTLVEETEQCISVLQMQLWDTIISLTKLELRITRVTENEAQLTFEAPC